MIDVFKMPFFVFIKTWIELKIKWYYKNTDKDIRIKLEKGTTYIFMHMLDEIKAQNTNESRYFIY